MAKAWTDKYGTLNKELDQVVHRANSEISALQQKVSGERSLVISGMETSRKRMN